MRNARRVIITHADQPIGRTLTKLLFYDDDVECIVALGNGPPPRSFDRFLSGSAMRLRYRRVDLAKHRPMADLFHSEELRALGLNALIHLPSHGPSAGADLPLIGRVSERTAEARLILRHCLEDANIDSLVTLGSAFVYRLESGNANRFTEDSELNFDPALPAELRSWVDCDMLFHGEVHSARLDVTLLRAPTVIASGGFAFMNPALQPGAMPHLRPLGFDPLCQVISDKDVARALRLGLIADASGIFNVAGREALPFSALARWTGGGQWVVPGPLLGGVARIAQLAGAERARGQIDGAHLRFGFTLDTTKAERRLGFRPGYRVGLSRGGDGQMRLETSPAA